MDELLNKVKLALRLSVSDFDDEVLDLISGALNDLRIAGVSTRELSDPLIRRAVTTYCRAHFGEPDEYERLKASYDEQKAQLQMTSGYTTWGDSNG